MANSDSGQSSQINLEVLKLVAFDLDGTLAPSKSPLPAQMARTLSRLLEKVEVCVISGGATGQFETQLLAGLQTEAPHANKERLHLMPTCGTRYLRFTPATQNWQEIYAHNLTPEQTERAIASLKKHAREMGLWCENPWGEIIENRLSQITFSALGQNAPLNEKEEWDPTGEKKNRLRVAVQADLPDLEVRSGGSTSVDITQKNVDKAYGMRQISKYTGYDFSQMLFFGDRLDPDGNDYPVHTLGVPCAPVTGWEDTNCQLVELLEAWPA